MTIRQQGGVFGRNPTFRDVDVEGDLTAASVDINGGTIDGTVIGGSTPAAINGTTGSFSSGVYLGGTGSANLLDDYEEGTWTPVYEGLAGSIGSTAYSTQVGRYTKIGRTVFATAEIVLTNKGSWTSGVRFTGLPFTQIGAQEVAIGSVILGNVDFAAGELYCNPRGTGASEDKFYLDITRDNNDRQILSTTAVADNSIFYINMIYTTT